MLSYHLHSPDEKWRGCRNRKQALVGSFASQTEGQEQDHPGGIGQVEGIRTRLALAWEQFLKRAETRFLDK
jgi:hypothetical protein